MESVFKTKIASRGWHVYQKTEWSKPKVGEKLIACKETNCIALRVDPFAVSWKLKKVGKVVPVVVGHVPREISRAIWFFLEKGGKVTGKVYEERCRPSPIPKGGLEIILKAAISIDDEKRKYLERLKSIISENYKNYEETESFSFHDGCQIEEKRQMDEETSKEMEEDIVFQDDDSEENDDDEEVVCLD